ncbi:coiled-coil domain-containing protein 166-like [Saccoglossus kowalevskii]|uniref:Coiled-coil domain-containing protein 166-like n=1 Tax=Saccoglossus kowalevskii TaxID=10224 RepID=A0ABM0GWP1_SACKO|nr:PREDICTED: coiled-coil domain-containing protein 166-like [Saccoglossus kowalevskii]
MPPKKGKGKGKGKGKKGKKAAAAAEGGDEGPVEPPKPTEKELLLRAELESLTEELAGLKKRVEELRHENEWLQQEAHQTRVESHEYMSYMSKKTHKRQTTIITLTDQNQKEIEDINKQKEEMLKEYEEKKQALRNILLEKEAELAKTKKELDDLEEFKRLQADQVQRIKDLEKEVMKMRGKHTDTIQKLKTQFLSEKRNYQQDSESKVNELAKQANREALHCLNEHTSRIKDENRELRRELLKLIQTTRALHEHKQELEDQRKQLMREQQYGNDLKTLKNSRQHKVLKSFGLLGDEDSERGSSACS